LAAATAKQKRGLNHQLEGTKAASSHRYGTLSTVRRRDTFRRISSSSGGGDFMSPAAIVAPLPLEELYYFLNVREPPASMEVAMEIKMSNPPKKETKSKKEKTKAGTCSDFIRRRGSSVLKETASAPH
jgi:hypothetical protein